MASPSPQHLPHAMPQGPSVRVLAVVPLLLALLAVLAAPPAVADEQPAHTARVTAKHLRASLLGDATAVVPGERLRLGVFLRMDPHWHVYWRQAGDAGLPPTFAWKVPEGFRVGAVRWPLPTRHDHGPLTGYIYDKEVLFVVEVTAPATIATDRVTLGVHVEWLVCEDDEGCIPGEAQLALDLPVARTARPSADAPTFDAWAKRLPQAAPKDATMRLGAEGLTIELPGEGPWQQPGARFALFHETWDLLGPREAPYLSRPEGTVVLEADYLPGRSAPAALRTLLVVEHEGARHGYTLSAGDAPKTTAPAAIPTATQAPNALPSEGLPTGALPTSDGVGLPPAEPVEDDLTWTEGYVEYGGGPQPSVWGALLLAFLGGILLNLMPCVLPVLSLKILGFVDKADSDPRRVRTLGYAFGVGVVASFLAIAGLLLALRAQGEQLGWGFQLQEPAVIVVLSLVMFLLGLNFVGVFEIGAGMTGLAGRAEAQVHDKGVLGSLASGALATVIATPCTAPFMGPAIGFALTQPTVAALAVFGALGLGMAAPYVLLAVFPGWLRFLPKPGPWMIRLREVMAFPMFATVLWLAWVYGRQTGPDAVIALLAGCLLVSIGAWLYGRFGTPARAARTRAIVGYGLALLAVGAGLTVALSGRTADPAAAGQPATAAHGWVPYDGHAIRAAREAGKPVFLDFTADWCLTCKANEQAFLDTQPVRDAVRRHDVVMMQADWTRRGPRITEALERLGRTSIPVYVIVPADPSKPAVVLRTAITTGYVVEALDEVLAP